MRTCFNIMIKTEQNINNKSISHSFGNKEITVASWFAVRPVLGLCSLGCECWVLVAEGQQAKESLAESSFYKGVSQSRGRVCHLQPNGHTYNCCLGG